MRNFVYLGDHREVTSYGVSFPAGEPVELDPVKDAILIKKLEGNNHFAEARDGFTITDNVIEAVEPVKVFAPELQHHDLTDLRAEAEALGVKVDMRWKEARLLAEIEKAGE